MTRGTSRGTRTRECQPAHRRSGWLSSGRESAVIFIQEDTPVVYALHREDADEVYLRQSWADPYLTLAKIG